MKWDKNTTSSAQKLKFDSDIQFSKCLLLKSDFNAPEVSSKMIFLSLLLFNINTF